MDRITLHKIDEELTKSEVAALKFLCMDHLSRKRLEAVKDAKDLFVLLSEQAKFEDELFLPDLLYTIGRCDLLHILGTNKNNVNRLLQTKRSGVSEYRKMLYKLSEDIKEETLRDIKFLLNSLPKGKLISATFLDVLVEMEKMEMLGTDNLDYLEDILRKCSKDLADEVQKFKMSIPDQENSISLSVPHQEESPSQLLDNPMESISLTNVSIAETNPPISTRTGSLPGSENTVDTDSEGRPVSENVPTNAINDECYLMTRRPLGHCLIINNHTFEETTKLSNRRGTDADREALTEVFERMHFIVEERRDLVSSAMQDAVIEFATKDHSTMDAFVCCILSHGEKGAVLGVDGKSVAIRDLTQPFAGCMTLTGKPKLFFIQACQGNDLQKGVWLQDGTEEDELEDDAKKADSRLPIEADFLIGMATVESYKSFRHTIKGSIFIQELCKHLKDWCPKKEDILSILTKVNRSVSAQELNNHKQMPEPRYTLTKKLVLPMD
ncbi:caspase-8 isoform X2 [Ictalurus furcatus]|uniref:caspase-8 isoform X2 n=1 Tax=Ictalurus furcatus TaxID=66913 RepID=UPI00234FF00D|nr:caspase-8 isoform X2 [Ictalurus furcatus]